MKKVFPKKGEIYKLSFTYNGKKIESLVTCLYSKPAEVRTSGGSVGIMSFYGDVSINNNDLKVTNFTFPNFKCIFEIREAAPYSLRYVHRYRIDIYPYDSDEVNRPNLHTLAEYLGFDASTLTKNYIKLNDFYPNFYFKLTKGE